jgi:hypothetical protein
MGSHSTPLPRPVIPIPQPHHAEAGNPLETKEIHRSRQFCPDA